MTCPTTTVNISRMSKRHTGLLVSALVLAATSSFAGNAKHIVVVVWDGMRPDFISPEHTPALAQLATHLRDNLPAEELARIIHGANKHPRNY